MSDDQLNNSDSDESYHDTRELRPRKPVNYRKLQNPRSRPSKVEIPNLPVADDYDDDLFESIAAIFRPPICLPRVSNLQNYNLPIISTSVVTPSINTLTNKFINILQIPFSSNSNIVITKMTSLCDIIKFTKLIGHYDADVAGASIRSHLTRLELYADIGTWSEDTKLAVGVSTIKNRAFDFLTQAKYTDYINFKRGLIEKFDSIDNVSLLSNQLFALRQGSDTIKEHAIKFDIILNKLCAINAPTLPTEILMNIFLDGVTFAYKRDILLQGITTYDAALKRAILMERLDSTDHAHKSLPDIKSKK